MANTNIGYYLMNLEVGNAGMPGAPILHLQLGVNAVTGQVNGQAQITQAIAPPDGTTVIPRITGHILDMGDGNRLVFLSGLYYYSFPPPIILTVQEHFSAALILGEDGSGRGSFGYGGHVIGDVPVTSV